MGHQSNEEGNRIMGLAFHKALQLAVQSWASRLRLPAE